MKHFLLGMTYHTHRAHTVCSLSAHRLNGPGVQRPSAHHLRDRICAIAALQTIGERGLGVRKALCVSAKCYVWVRALCVSGSNWCSRLMLQLGLAGVQSIYPHREQLHQQSCQHYRQQSWVIRQQQLQRSSSALATLCGLAGCKLPS